MENSETILANSEDSKENEVFPLWSDLPSPAVVKTYSFLNRTDQRSMSLVCRNWREELSSPSLWRYVKFSFLDIEDREKLRPEVIFARKYGTMFRHVEIVLPKASNASAATSSLTADGVLRQMIWFLEAVTRHSQLLVITFTYMNFFSLIRAGETRRRLSELFEKILNFLKSQKKLQGVNFSKSGLKKAGAAEILNAVFVNNSNTLRYLVLLEFVLEQNEEVFQYSDSVGDNLNYTVLMSLDVLIITYSQFFENMILSFYEYRNRVDNRDKKGRLKGILLVCDGRNMANYSGIRPPVWNDLRSIFPDLRVDLGIGSPLDPASFSTYFVPHMPLRSLFILASSRHGQVTAVGSLMRHITSCNLKESIEEFALVYWEGVSLGFFPDLISFTDACLRLKTLELIMEHPVEGLNTVLDSWLENRPISLEAVKIYIALVPSEQEERVYTNLIDVYAPSLQPLALSLSFLAERFFAKHFLLN